MKKQTEQTKSNVTKGDRFGKLTVLEEAPRRSGRRFWRCVCDCGNEREVAEAHLKNGHTQSCGCLSRKYPDLAVGMRFSRLILIEKLPRNAEIQYWRCLCDCGNECKVQEGHLKSGHTKSCGCRSRKHPDLAVGMRFGQLTLIEKLPRNTETQFWRCRCDCGSECKVADGHLKSGHTKSCGCRSRKHPDLAVGMRFSQLTLIEKLPRSTEIQYWLCRCDCGNECKVQEGHLKSGHTQSCGCLAPTARRARTPDLTGQRFGRLTVLERAIDPEKNILVWKCRCDCGQIISCQAEDLTSGHTKSCGCLRDDQRRENMKNSIHFVDGTCIEKIACQRETAANTSGHRGVHPLRNGRFRAALTFKNKRYDLGTHATFEEAVDARLKAEQRYYGEFLERYYAEQKAGEE